VDNYSVDKTREIASKYGARIFCLDSERAAAKNYGITKSEGEYIMFVDSDMELNTKVIEECIVLMKNDSMIGGIIIPERSVGDNFWVKVRDFERSFYTSTEIESARFFVRDLLNEVDGFDEEVVFFEESTLPQKIERLGYNVKARIKARISHHEDVFSLLSWLKRKYFYGKTSRKYKMKYKKYGEKQASLPYRFSLFLLERRFYLKPTLAIGVLTLKFLEYFATGLGYLTTK
jgi:glycosyltransferase involved in cell wall biosynthesis